MSRTKPFTVQRRVAERVRDPRQRSRALLGSATFGLGLTGFAITACLSSLSAGCNLRYDVLASENSAGAAGFTGGTAGVNGGVGAVSGDQAGMAAAGVMAVGGMAGVAGAGAVSGMAGIGDSAGTGRVEDFSWACVHGGRCEQLPVAVPTKLDVLFIIDNSGSMIEEQLLLRTQFSNFIAVLTTGDRDGDGTPEFRPIESLQLGVVSSDLGLSGVVGIPDCEALGDDGVLNNVSSLDVPICRQPIFTPRFLAYTAAPDTAPTGLSLDLECIATLGNQGCGFEQQLESGLKALWPSEDDRVQFLADAAGFGNLGQGGVSGPNNGFLRPDSVLAIVLLTDEDDCSSMSTSHFRVDDGTLAADDPLRMQGLNTRCHFEGQRAEPNNIYDPSRYINAFQALREGHEQDVVFAAITGVPPDAVITDAPEYTDTISYYDSILADARMQEVIDDQGTPDIADDNLVPACDTDNGKAYPARRITEVVRGFGENGVLGSICDSDFGPTIERLTDKVASHFPSRCLPGAISRSAGTIDCEVIWELPLRGEAPNPTPTQCEDPGFEFLSATMRGSPNERVVCSVAQLGIDESVDEILWPFPTDGFYYDDFSDETERECLDGARIAFTPGAEPPPGVNVYLDCTGPLVTE